MESITLKTNQELKKEIASGKLVRVINGVVVRDNLGELKVSNKHVYISTYTPLGGHNSIFLEAPFVIEFE